MPSTREDGMPVLRPLPQRNWQLTPTSTEPPTPPSEQGDQSPDADQKSMPPSRSRSILNLTSSTLFGIYAGPSGEELSQGGTTPGMMTPSSPNTPYLGGGEDKRSPVIGAFERPELRRTPQTHQKFSFANTLMRSTLLFSLGLGYGEVATRLHEETELIPIKMEGINRHSWQYMLFWGVAGVILGNMLPWIDGFWRKVEEYDGAAPSVRSTTKEEESKESSTDWSLPVRGIGAFIGISFAIRRLPWASSMQASLTLALANPALWFLLDRTITGFVLSTLVGVGGAGMILGVNPGWVPSPWPAVNSTMSASGAGDLGGIVSYESITVFTWVASTLFCSCVCFGNAGRMLGGRSNT